jgi:hypothetical protein
VGLTTIPTIIVPRRTEAFDGSTVHPNISPLRVVGVRDRRMTNPVELRTGWAQEEKLVNWDPVQEDMDRLACGLAEESSPADAWKKIFLKPAGKSWSDVVVAIKINRLGVQRTRSAVLAKVCHAFTDVVGAKGSNVYVFDGCTGGGMASQDRYQGLPQGVTLADQWGGYNLKAAVPAPYADGQRQAPCLDHLVKGEVDILVNIALCKGHGSEFGGFTMCMKNHFGTFSPNPSHGPGGGADYMIGINRAPEILGPVDPQTGNVIFPRQQLCIVDALWASRPGPGEPSDSQPNVILMGTFPPVVDYLGAMRLRKDVMHWPVNEQITARLLSDFGYSERDLPNGGRIIDVTPQAG